MHRPPTFAVATMRGVLLLAAVATVYTAMEWSRRARPSARREALGVSVALFSLAFVVRWSASPHTLIHENYHGYDYVSTRALPLLEASLFREAPSAHRFLIALVNEVFPASLDPVFVFDASLSALGVPALYWLAARIFERRSAGVAAASLLMFHPLSLFMAPTEEPLNLVAATACGGMVLVHYAVTDGVVASLVAGCALIATAALTRDVTLPLAALAPLAMLGARRSPKMPRWALLAACVALGAALLPQAFAILGALRSHPESSGLLAWPHLPFARGDSPDGGFPLSRNYFWVGWADPYVPTWLGWALCASWPLLALRCAARRDWRMASLGVLAPLAANLHGHLSHGWFPSGLRHGLFAMTLGLLPVAWLLDALAGLLPPRLDVVRWLAAPVLCVLAAAAGRFASRPPLPIALEYRVLRRAVDAMAPGDHFVTLPPGDLTHPSSLWVHTLRPDVRTLSVDALSEVHRGAAWLVLDRLCSLDRECFRNPSLCAAGVERRAPRDGSLARECRQALDAKPWRLVRRTSFCVDASTSAYRQPYDLPPYGGCSSVDVYRWSP